MSIDAMKQALEALETIADEVFSPYDNQLGNAILALRLAIEQAERQEPVAWMVYTLDGTAAWVTLNPADFTSEHRGLPLYTAPPQRQPLTGEEMQVAVAVEREACAKVAEEGLIGHTIAKAIRARGNNA